MPSIIDLYAKFLIAFVGIVTPALALYLNSYFINRTLFEKLINKEKSAIKSLLDLQKELGKEHLSDKNLIEKSNEGLSIQIKKIEKWEGITTKLNPKTFFQSNVFLLFIAMGFLFIWLIFRAYSQYLGQCYFTLQILASIISIGACAIHIYKLYDIGIYLIKVRPDVEEINSSLRKEETIMQQEPRQEIKK